MIRPWIFEFTHAPFGTGEDIVPGSAAAAFEAGMRRWQLVEALDFEGIFFSEHHFGLSYSPSPNLLIATVAQRTRRIRLGTMGVVLPFYQPWRVLEEIAMLDHLTGGRLEIGCASGVPQELIQVGLTPEDARERFNEALEILDAGLTEPVISHHGKHWQFENLKILPRPLQQPAPPKWTPVVSEVSARKSAGRGSKICTAFQSVETVTAIFDAYRDEAYRLGAPAGPEQLAIRRNISVADTESEARELSSRAREMSRKVLAGDPRVGTQKSDLIDAPQAKKGFTVHDDEFIAGTPAQVAERLIEQCRATRAGHVLGIIGRGTDDHGEAMLRLYGETVVPALRRA